MTPEGYAVSVTEHIGHEDIVHEPVYLSVKNAVSITYKVETDFLRRHFSFRLDGQPWQDYKTLENVYYLCDEAIRMDKRFTGAMIGMYAYAGEKPYTAKVLGFSYGAK